MQLRSTICNPSNLMRHRDSDTWTSMMFVNDWHLDQVATRCQVNKRKGKYTNERVNVKEERSKNMQRIGTAQAPLTPLLPLPSSKYY